jgi:hypothetical protein
MEPLDSETLVAAANDTAMKVGEGADSPVTLHGGRFVFDTANEDLLSPSVTGSRGGRRHVLVACTLPFEDE